MGLFTRDKVDGEVGTDAPVDDTAASNTINSKTGISRFARRRKATTDVPATRSATAGAVSNKAIRLVQLLLAILILGLTAYAIDIYQATFLQSAYIPALVAAILTILATIPLAFLSRLPGLSSHRLSTGSIDLFFALFWLAIMAELAAYSDIAAPRSLSYYTGGFDQHTDVDAAYAAYNGTISKLQTAWACGAAAAAFAGVEFVLFLVSALLPLRGHFLGPVTGSDSAGAPTNHHGSGLHSGNEAAFEMQTRNAGHTGPASPASATAAHGVNSTDGPGFDRANMI